MKNVINKIKTGSKILALSLAIGAATACSNPTSSSSNKPVDPIPIQVQLTSGQALEEILNDGYVDIQNSSLSGIEVTGDYDPHSITWSSTDNSGSVSYDSNANTLSLNGTIPYGNIDIEISNLLTDDIYSIQGLTNGPDSSLFYATKAEFDTEFGGFYNMQPGIASEPNHYNLEQLSDMFSGELEPIYNQLVQQSTTEFSYGKNVSKDEYFVKVKDVDDTVTVYNLTQDQFDLIEENNPYNIF